MDKDEITAIVKRQINAESLAKAVIYIYRDLLPAGKTANIGRQSLEIKKPAFLIFADLQPGANWAHPCRYLLVDKDDGHVMAIEAHFPPDMENYALLLKGENVENWMLMTHENKYGFFN